MVRSYIPLLSFAITIPICFFNPKPLDELKVNFNFNESPKDDNSGVKYGHDDANDYEIIDDNRMNTSTNMEMRMHIDDFSDEYYHEDLDKQDYAASSPTFDKCGLVLSSHVTLELFDSDDFPLTGDELTGECSSHENRVSEKPTKVVMHGFKRSGKRMKKVGWVEARKKEENLIIVDWSKLAGVGKKRGYYTAASCAIEVGKYLAQCFIDMNIDVSKLHLFGHSLGAHGLGMTGRKMAESGRKPSRVTGMDPAGPGFVDVKWSAISVTHAIRLREFGLQAETVYELKMNKIGRDSGHFVDIVHTNAGELGVKDALGHIDYYVNGGGPIQPKCSKMPGFNLKQSHSYSVKVVVASLLNEPQDFWKKSNPDEKWHFDVENERNENIPDGDYYLQTSIEC